MIIWLGVRTFASEKMKKIFNGIRHFQWQRQQHHHSEIKSSYSRQFKKWRLFTLCDTVGHIWVIIFSIIATGKQRWHFDVFRSYKKWKKFAKTWWRQTMMMLLVGCCLSCTYATMKTNCHHFCSKKNDALRTNNQRAILITNDYELAQLSLLTF